MDQKEQFLIVASLKQNYTRFVCAMMLHLQLQDEFKEGNQIMKYVNNHPERFQSWLVPFVLGFMQSSMIVLIEVVNLVNICAQIEVMDIVMNYVALAVVADFDDIFVMST